MGSSRKSAPYRLYYYQDPEGNFGDDLNRWLWPQITNGLVDVNVDMSMTSEDERPLFVGMGTVLNHYLPADRYKVVLGAGVGYGKPPKVDDKWKIYCVRGPKSAEALNIDSGKAVTDAAALVRLFDLPDVEKRYDVSFMPHRDSCTSTDWSSTCQAAGAHLIDPRSDVKEVLLDFKRSRLVLAEAMHAAIVADALRIPWTPVRLHSHINQFKWRDWCLSLSIAYEPFELPFGLRLVQREDVPLRFRRLINHVMGRIGLKESIRKGSCLLSPKKEIERSTARLKSCVERFVEDQGKNEVF